MKRESTLLLSGMIILATATVLGSLFAGLEFLATQSRAPAVETLPETVTQADASPNELVILHQQPITIGRFDLTVTLTAHEKINDRTVATTITVASATDQAASGTLAFTGIGEYQQLGQYRFRLVNATTGSIQLLIAELNQ